VVYEPAWAIGADTPAAADHVRVVVTGLKQWLTDNGAQRPTIIYGGTVTPRNVGQFTAIDVLDGVGATRAMLNERGFLTIVRQVADAGIERPAG
jgi:triosephosphate isomerase